MRLDADRGANLLKISIEPLIAPLKGPFNVHLVRYAPMKTVEITSGENAGRTLDYANVVSDWSVIGQWDGAEAAELTAPLDGNLPAVVLIQATGPGAIVAAARAE